MSSRPRSAPAAPRLTRRVFGQACAAAILASGSAAFLANGSAAGQPRPGANLGIAAIPNLRDVGGYCTAGGDVVRTGLLYRSDQPDAVSAEEMARLAALRLTNVYDLRTAAERGAHPDRLPSRTRLTVLDVLADADQSGPAQLERLLRTTADANRHLGGGRAEALFLEAYRAFVALPSARAAYRQLFTAVAEPQNLPALFHCTTGKDRTGWAAAALLTFLGVQRDEVMQDYLRSNDHILPAYRREIDAFVAAGGDPAIPRAILGVRRDYLDAGFDEVARRHGSVEAYFADGLGLDAPTRAALRATLLHPVP